MQAQHRHQTRWLYCVECPQYSTGIWVVAHVVTSFTVCRCSGMSLFWLLPFWFAAVLTTLRRHQVTPTQTVNVMTWRVVQLVNGRIMPKICQGQPPTMYSECSRFHPNQLTFGGVIAKCVNTAKTCHKVNPIFGCSLASSRITILYMQTYRSK